MESLYNNPLENTDKLEAIDQMMSQRPNYTIKQIYGQRIYRPENDEFIEERKNGSEVFIGRLPRDCYEDELVPLVEQFGTIRRMRLMMDFSGTNRGYGFVEYVNSLDAERAAKALDQYEIRDNRSIGVMISWDKSRLFIGGIPKQKTKKEVLKEMKRVTEGVKDVIIYMSAYNSRNRGFCFVEYQTHHDAAMARRKMGPGFKLWNRYEVRVDWADPEPIVEDEVMKCVRILHVRNLHYSITEEELKEVFSFDGFRITRVKKIRDFAFIHYESREDTETALHITNSIDFPKKYPSYKSIQVSLARPQKCKQYRKRTQSSISIPTESPNCESIPGSGYPELLPPPQTQVDQQLKYYTNLCHNSPLPNPMNQMVPMSYGSPPMMPLKYETIGDKNSNVVLVWVPVVWVPHNHNGQNQNKELTINNNIFNKY